MSSTVGSSRHDRLDKESDETRLTSLNSLDDCRNSGVSVSPECWCILSNDGQTILGRQKSVDCECTLEKSLTPSKNGQSEPRSFFVVRRGQYCSRFRWRSSVFLAIHGSFSSWSDITVNHRFLASLGSRVLTVQVNCHLSTSFAMFGFYPRDIHGRTGGSDVSSGLYLTGVCHNEQCSTARRLDLPVHNLQNSLRSSLSVDILLSRSSILLDTPTIDIFVDQAYRSLVVHRARNEKLDARQLFQTHRRSFSLLAFHCSKETMYTHSNYVYAICICTLAVI